MTEARPEAVFAAIAKQTGYRLGGPRHGFVAAGAARAPRVSVEFDGKPFWHAFRESVASRRLWGSTRWVRPIDGSSCMRLGRRRNETLILSHGVPVFSIDGLRSSVAVH
jgi:hypothetical protein